MIVSIDIGTSYSSICRLGPDGRAQPVDISTGASMFGSKYSLPSAVFVEDSGNVLVGQAAMNSRKHRPQNFRMEFKRNLGEDVPILLGERSFLPEELYTELFRHMKACAEKVDGEQVERAFLTYPVSYGKKRKEKLCAAAKAAGLFDLELVDEPTAAAMCYCAEGYIEDGQTLLVYDFGGGTFDVSVIRYKDGAFRLLAEPEGLERCGGMDIDYLIAKDMWETVGREAPDGLEALEKNRNRHMRFASQLNELAVKAKHHLSAAEVFEEYIEIGADDVCYRLTTERFNEMAAPLIGQTIQICRHALEEAGVSASELSAVLLVGGTSRIPLVKEMAQKISGKQPLCAADLELAVAQGALEYCIYQERDKARQEEEIKAKERARQEAKEKECKKQEAKAKKKARQEAEEKKRRKQEEEAREREHQDKGGMEKECNAPFGNTSRNISSGGYIAEADGWVYFSNLGNTGWLCRCRASSACGDMSGFEVLVKSKCSYINVLNDLVYYYDEYENSICSIRINGTDRKILMHTGEEFSHLYVRETEMYYISLRNRIMRRIKGRQPEIITKCNWDEMAMEGDWIYYAGTDDHCLYKIRTNGTGRKKLSNEIVRQIRVVDGWIYYYTMQPDGFTYYVLGTKYEVNSISRVRIDGTDEEKVWKKGMGGVNSVETFNILDEWIYLEVWRTEQEIWRIRTDGTGMERFKMNGTMVNGFDPHIAGGQIYIHTFDAMGGFRHFNVK